MALVINIIKCLLWTVEICGPIKGNVLFRFGVKHNAACQHSQQTRYTGPMLVQCWPTVCALRSSIKPALVQRFVFAGLRAGLLVVTACGEYKPTPNQCLVNVGPASSVLGSIHSAPVSTT